MPGCLILDDDELHVPFAKSPIDEYRGTGKKVIRNTYIQSLECAFKCIPHQIGKGNTCDCNDREKHLSQKMADIKEQLTKYDDRQQVSFGKYKGYRWCNMFGGKESLSWVKWYIKNCSNQSDFYEYLVLHNEYIEIESQWRSVKNPYYE